MKSVFISILFSLFISYGMSQSTTAVTWQKQTTVPHPGKQDDICFTDENYGW